MKKLVMAKFGLRVKARREDVGQHLAGVGQNLNKRHVTSLVADESGAVCAALPMVRGAFSGS
ncbi:hypothetical protein [Brucella intermedia]|uniref:Uncharacterized protein n=1 Tax=Brucella intermedia TaxID=94625 RepID=A0A7V6PG60_9HYPH|nr:hypothetical protein [Brucella intermedia]WGG59078.1 hypothetical protein QA414_12220 [Brucella intermedia]HHV70213.1 hypothetical protein [Brucella intermedia]